jgi:hypothetical protein
MTSEPVETPTMSSLSIASCNVVIFDVCQATQVWTSLLRLPIHRNDAGV